MSAAATFEEPVRGLDPDQADESAGQSTDGRRVAMYGVVLVGGIAVGEAAWLSAIAYALYRLVS